MPFNGPSSYLPTTDEFIGHWTDVNVELTPDLILAGPYALADLQADRDALSDAITALVEGINDVEGHRTDRDNQKLSIKERQRQLDSFIRGFLASSSYVGRIPEAIDMLANPGKWLISMRDHRNIWTDIHATPPAGFTPPLLLAGGYTLATFTTDIAALETTFESLSLTEQDVDRLLDERDALYLAIRAQLVLYREAVLGSFAEDHPLVLSLPRLDPLPGHTPDPVVLTGVWNQTISMADLSWTASADADLASYQVRRNGNTPYNSNLEQVVETLPPGTLVLSTNEGFSGPGASMGYKVYVVLNTSNESGSNAVTVVGP